MPTSANTVTVNYTTVNGSAVSPTDYSTTSGQLTFGPGQTEQSISVPITDRMSSAPSRSFTVVLSSPSNATIVQSTATVTIGASGGTAQSSPYIYAPPHTVIAEADGWVDLPVTLGAPSANSVTVNWTLPAGNCNGGPLFVVGANGTTQSSGMAGAGTLTFVPGQVLQVIRVQVNQCDNNGEESATLVLSGPTGGGIIADPLTVIDVVGDGNLVATPGLYIRGNTVDTTAGIAQVPVMLGGPAGATSTSTVTVNYTTVNGSAVSPTDYSTTSGQLTFGPGQTEQSISVPITDRMSSAPSRSFTVVLSSPSNATIVQSTATVTIGASGGTAQSSPSIFAPPNLATSESSGWVDLPVTLGARSTNQVAVNWSVPSNGCSGGGVLSGTGSGTLTFVPGQVLRVIRMQVNPCNLTTNNSVSLTLSGAVNGIIGNATTVITVTPPQAVPTITSFTPTAGAVGATITIKGTNLENATSVTFNGKKVIVTSTTFTKDTSAKLKLKVPAGAKSGTLTVTTTGGSVTSATKFTVT